MPQSFFPQPGDLFWTPADWAWIGGLLDVLLPAWHHGVPVVARRLPKFDPEQAFKLLADRSEEHTSELQSLMRISYAVFCLKKKKIHKHITTQICRNNNSKI